MNTKNLMRSVAVLALFSGLLGGCSFVSSAQGGSDDVTGEAWYVRTSFFGGGKIFYCPAGEPVCYRATMVKN